ncbi:MAG: hypothetical protein HRT42_08980 [Campylobacteraceae bacterium]|nr:hypothetical protein [Campylobacteraceae bacterium]
MYNNIIDIKLQISFASNTIDDVRKFYKLNKDKKSFSVLKEFESSYKIVNSQFKSSNTKLKFNNNDIEINTYENEFEQVIVNILNNSHDVVLNKLKNESFFPLVEINILELNNKIRIKIVNNC